MYRPESQDGFGYDDQDIYMNEIDRLDEKGVDDERPNYPHTGMYMEGHEEMEFEVDREDYADEFEDDGQPTEYEEWQDLYGGDDWDHGQYDSYDGE